MSQAFGGGGGYGRFPPINQGPAGMPVGPPNDPPGYYLGWPLANLGKRVVAGVLDWGVFWFAALMVAGLGANAVSAVIGQSAGEFAGGVLLIGAYGALFYNFAILQNRTGQSWGKRMLGLRTVSMIELRPPGKPTLALKPLFEVFEVLTGIAFVAIALSRYRQTLSERFCSVVVLDERKAGATLPWVLPGDPVLDPGPPVPQGGVPRPERPRRREEADPGPAPWTRSPSSGPGRGKGDDHGDLPEPEFGDEAPPRQGRGGPQLTCPPWGTWNERTASAS